MTCLNCNAVCSAGTYIQCDGCQGNLHLSCAGLTESDIKMTRSKSRSLKVVCNICNSNMSQFRDLKSFISDMKQEFTNSLEKLRADFEEKLNTFKNEYNSREGASKSDNFEEVVQEVVDRQSRTNNLIFFGMPEPVEDAARSGVDRELCVEVLKLIVPNNRFQIISSQRLGQFDVNNVRARPYRVTLGSREEVSQILKHTARLKGSVYSHLGVSSDKTPRQNAYYKSVSAELRARAENGETNLVIRHVRGIPTIKEIKPLN